MVKIISLVFSLFLYTNSFAETYIYDLGEYGEENNKSSYWAVTDTLVEDYSLPSIVNVDYGYVSDLADNIFNKRVDYIYSFNNFGTNPETNNQRYLMLLHFKYEKILITDFGNIRIDNYPSIDEQNYYLDSLVFTRHDSTLNYIQTYREWADARKDCVSAITDSIIVIEEQ